MFAYPSVLWERMYCYNFVISTLLLRSETPLDLSYDLKTTVPSPLEWPGAPPPFSFFDELGPLFFEGFLRLLQ